VKSVRARIVVPAALLLWGACVAYALAASHVGIGVNYDWWKLVLTSLKECRADGEPRTVGTWILPQYHDATVRATVRAQLRAMHASGFTTLRVLVFHDHTTDAYESDSFTSTDGHIAPADADKLRGFVTDVASAGFSTLEIVPSFVSENDLYCRVRAWGDCFDPRRTGENWRFIKETADTVTAAAGPLALRFDLANEAAPDPRMPPRALRQAKTYLTTIAGKFEAEFGDDWLISAARSNNAAATETADRLELLVKDLASAGLHPRYLELHTYSDDGNDLVESLNDMQALAQRIDAGIVLGELRYHSAVQASAIAGWLAKTPDSRLIDVIQWPEYDPSNVCAIDPAPPYTPGLMRDLNPSR
jgi:hypothetical protein